MSKRLMQFHNRSRMRNKTSVTGAQTQNRPNRLNKGSGVVSSSLNKKRHTCSGSFLDGADGPLNSTLPANRNKLNRTLSNARNNNAEGASGKNRDKTLMQQTLAAIPTSGSNKLYKKGPGSNVGSASDAAPSPDKNINGGAASSLSNRMGAGGNKISTRSGAVRATRGAAMNTANAVNSAAEREASTGRMPGGNANGNASTTEPRKFLRAGGGSQGHQSNSLNNRAPSERRKSQGPTSGVSRVPSRESQRGKSANRAPSGNARNGAGNGGSYGTSNGGYGTAGGGGSHGNKYAGRNQHYTTDRYTDQAGEYGGDYWAETSAQGLEGGIRWGFAPSLSIETKTGHCII